jgi:hypothetical protein
MKYYRLCADEDGESHAKEVQAAFAMAQYAPPFGISEARDVARYIMVDFLAGWTSGLQGGRLEQCRILPLP